MKRIVIINPTRVWVEGAQHYVSLEALLEQQPTNETLLIGVIPTEVGRVLATSRTLDAAMTQQYPGENSYSTQPLEANVHQVYVAPDALLGKLRKLARDVRIVPYPAAVLATVMKQRPQRSLIERTQVFLGTKDDELETEGREREVLAIDMIGDEYLMTAIRSQEVVAVRYAQGDVVTEIQRTLAGARMDAPVLLCKDEQLSLELQAQGFQSENLESSGPLIGAGALQKVEPARFLNQFEVAQKRRAESRRKALGFLAVAFLSLLVAAGAWAIFGAKGALAVGKSRELEQQKQEQLDALAGLYGERYGTFARARSLQIRDEVFDLMTVLPPQVLMMSVKKDATGTQAVVERRPQAAPFNSDDLRAALRASSFFSAAQISEEYDGHLIRYVLKVAPQSPPSGTP
jgi:hypothetical protein